MRDRAGRAALLLPGMVVAAIASVLVATPPAALPGLPDSDAVRIGLPVVRVLLDAVGIGAVGIGVLGWLLRGERRAAAITATAQRAGVVLGAAWVLTALALIWWQAAELSPNGLGLRIDELAEYSAQVSSGRALLVTAACGLAFAVLSLVTTRSRTVPVELPAVVGLLGVVALPLTGHAAASAGHTPAMLATAVHVLAATAWVGGLLSVFVLVAPHRALLASVLPKFSRLAACCLAAVAVSGVVSAVVQLAVRVDRPLLDALTGTGYGWLVIVKAVLLTGLGGIGAWLRFRLLPGLSPGASARSRLVLAGWITAELLVMALAVGLGAALGRVAPG
ncbi:CopD family protein [Allokutzneria sp. A3M-2-11 16]|uniref:copper resistance D family protein n=1 Tax=Allokutzneria sp. A3M-2-11 16 TaxID=2962043 RepID=UPI0020B7E1E1|nr:CopD family protein [Allokutzneria sp. A3M-2-11 16]MCP3799545.1 CopD family protein [Allokutzneria sp. A3M-2-11 16]